MNTGVGWPPRGDRPDPGIEPVSLTSPALAGGFFTASANLESVSSVAELSDSCDPMDCSTPGLPVRHQHRHFGSPLLKILFKREFKAFQQNMLESALSGETNSHLEGY